MYVKIKCQFDTSPKLLSLNSNLGYFVFMCKVFPASKSAYKITCLKGSARYRPRTEQTRSTWRTISYGL